MHVAGHARKSFLIVLLLFIAFVVGCRAVSAWSWDASFRYVIPAYGTSVGFNDTVYLSGLWDSNNFTQASFYDVYLSTSDAPLSVLRVECEYANVTFTVLNHNLQTCFDVYVFPSQTGSVNVSASSQPLSVTIGGVMRLVGDEWTFDSGFVRLTVPYSQPVISVVLDWNVSPPSTASVTFLHNRDGYFYVNGLVVANGTVLSCSAGSVLSLAAVPFSSSFSLSDFIWTGGSSNVSPCNYTVSGDDSVWLYFTESAGSGGGGGGTGSVGVNVLDNYVSVVHGSSVSFQLTVTWDGTGNLTVVSVHGAGDYADWFSVVDALPLDLAGGTGKIGMMVSPAFSVSPDEYGVAVAVQVRSGSNLYVKGCTVHVTVTGGQQGLGLIPEVMVFILLGVTVVAGFYGFIARRRR